MEGACAAEGSPSEERGCGAPGGADKGGFRPSLVKRAQRNSVLGNADSQAPSSMP